MLRSIPVVPGEISELLIAFEWWGFVKVMMAS